MTRLFYCFLALVLSLNLTSCATTAKNPVAVGQGIESHTPPEGMGTIYLYRNQHTGSAGSIRWQLDDIESGYLRGYSHLRLDVLPGSHKVRTATIEKLIEPSEITIDVVVGQKYFIKQKFEYLVLSKLELKTPEEAFQDISQTNPSAPVVVKSNRQPNVAINRPAENVEQSVIVIYNDSGIGQRASISLNNIPIATLVNRNYLHIKVVPGFYEIKSDGGTANLQIEVKAGKTQYVKQVVTYFGGRKLGLSTGVKLHLADVESFTKYLSNVAFLNADIDFKAESPPPYYIEGGATYQGEFEHDYPNGKGKITFPKGSSKVSYEGDIKYGRITGAGTIVQDDGIVYTGDVEDGMSHGKGIVKFTDSTYEGDFFRNVLWGNGTYKYRDGSVYEGSVKKGVPDGKGKFTRIDGSSFVGEFEGGKLKNGIFYSSTGQPLNNNQTTSASSTSSTELAGFVKDLAFFTLKMVSAYYSGRTATPLSDDMLGLGTENKRSSFDTGNANANKKYEVDNRGCSSDFYCGVGYSCVKKPSTNNGVCMMSVDSDGVRNFASPSTDSIGVRTTDGCRFNTDCPVGFSCDEVYKACVRK